MISQSILLIDGDIIAFQAAAAAEQAIQWDADLWTLHSDIRDAKRIFNERMEEINDHLPNSKIVFALSPAKNFRYRVWPQYKANRADKRKPLVLKALKDWIEETFFTYSRPDIEGDDILGILATSPVILPGKKIIVSIDKDMKTIPCKLCDTRTWEVKEVSKQEAEYAHMYQTLIGDTADGYPGCPGIGPVTATKALDGLVGYSQLWPKVVECYAKKHLGEDYALTMARLARICQRTDYDFKKKEVILWNPPV